jgi:hypothetical protein
MAEIYRLEHPPAPWGDYGAILMHGMSMYLERDDGRIQLMRTGPFIPPISFPGVGDVVVTDAFKQQLEQSGLSGFTFRPVVKRHIVRLEWEDWDWDADEPPDWPAEGDPEHCEPEDYILQGEHSPEVAKQLGDLWEVCLEEHADIARVRIGSQPWDEEIYLVPSSWDGTDLFRARGGLGIYASERAREWLERIVPQWVSFSATVTADSSDAVPQPPAPFPAYEPEPAPVRTTCLTCGQPIELGTATCPNCGAVRCPYCGAPPDDPCGHLLLAATPDQRLLWYRGVPQDTSPRDLMTELPTLSTFVEFPDTPDGLPDEPVDVELTAAERTEMFGRTAMLLDAYTQGLWLPPDPLLMAECLASYLGDFVLAVPHETLTPQGTAGGVDCFAPHALLMSIAITNVLKRLTEGFDRLATKVVDEWEE